MKHKFLVLFLCLFSSSLFGQWKYTNGEDKFSGKFRLAYVIGSGSERPFNNPKLAVEYTEGREPEIYIADIGYTGCDKQAIDISFNDSDEYYSYEAVSNINNDAAFISFKSSIGTAHYNRVSFDEIIDLLKEKKTVYIRYSSECSASQFQFTLSGSNRAIEYCLDPYYKWQKEKSQKEELAQIEERNRRATLISEFEYYFDCGTPLQSIVSFKPEYNDMPLKVMNPNLFEETRTVGKFHEFTIYNRWAKGRILVTVNRFSKQVYFIKPQDLWKLTENEVIKYLKDNHRQYISDCGVLSDQEMSLLMN